MRIPLQGTATTTSNSVAREEEGAICKEEGLSLVTRERGQAGNGRSIVGICAARPAPADRHKGDTMSSSNTFVKEKSARTAGGRRLAVLNLLTRQDVAGIGGT